MDVDVALRSTQRNAKFSGDAILRSVSFLSDTVFVRSSSSLVLRLWRPGGCLSTACPTVIENNEPYPCPFAWPYTCFLHIHVLATNLHRFDALRRQKSNFLVLHYLTMLPEICHLQNGCAAMWQDYGASCGYVTTPHPICAHSMVISVFVTFYVRHAVPLIEVFCTVHKLLNNLTLGYLH